MLQFIETVEVMERNHDVDGTLRQDLADSILEEAKARNETV